MDRVPDEGGLPVPSSDRSETGSDGPLPPSGESDEQVVALEHVATSAYCSGPLPLPERKRQCDTTLPGAAERILAMAERPAEHREQLESLAMTAASQIGERGQAFGFVIAMTSIVGGLVLPALDRPLLGAAAARAAIGGLTALFAARSAGSRREPAA